MAYFEGIRCDWGSSSYKKYACMMPTDGLEQLRNLDGIDFGAVGAPGIPDHFTLWGLRLLICQGIDQYANIRPTRIFPEVSTSLRGKGIGDLDRVIHREDFEGEHSDHGGWAHGD